jgi:hypothetical protein
VSILVASNTIPATVQYFVTATAHDLETGFLSCDRLKWEISLPDTLSVNSENGTCAATIIFPQEGTRTLTVTATDPHGGKSSKSIFVTVTSPPQNQPPVITPDSFSVMAHRGPKPLCTSFLPCEAPDNSVLFNGQTGDYIPPLYLSLEATDPEGDPITVQWFCETGAQEASVTDNGDGTFKCDPIYSPSESIVVRAVVSDGITLVNAGQRTYVMLQRIN